MGEPLAAARHLRLVPEGDGFTGLGHSDRAALMITQLLNVWKESLTGGLSSEQASRISFDLVSDHLRAVERER
ncbi:hypothetical protein IZ6_29320 [Terrihabitans soli]|uniref:Uncharacterized protein n=1 Tax=Terrihabitans soli TaxID=708113 RepID=A0A6S6QW95_9HYPH|nr:hypothetical protein [Terrihabitans soli]BCJ92197.1 hypothetical protein IZ6_29320 [Terrihabitans soli]